MGHNSTIMELMIFCQNATMDMLLFLPNDHMYPWIQVWINGLGTLLSMFMIWKKEIYKPKDYGDDKKKKNDETFWVIMLYIYLYFYTYMLCYIILALFIYSMFWFLSSLFIFSFFFLNILAVIFVLFVLD